MFKLVLNTYKRSFSGLSRETWLLSTVMLINRCGYMAVPFMGLYVTQSLHRSTADAGLIIALFGIGALAGAATGGKLTDVIGFRPVQIYSSLIGGALFLLFATIEHFESLCALSVVISFFYEAFRPANFAATAAYASEGNATRSYSLNRLATNVGWAVGVSLGGLIASYNYKLLFVADGAVSIVAGLLILFLLKPSRHAQVAKNADVKTVTVLKPWQDIPFIRFILLNTIFAACFYLMFRVIPIFFKEEWHMDESYIGIVLGINGVIIALFEMVMINYLENRRAPVYYIVIGIVLTSAGFLLLLLPVKLHLPVAIVSMVFFTVGEMFAIPFINTFVISRSNEHNRGQYAGGYTLSWSLASVAGPAFGFFLAGTFGYSVLWILLAVLLVGSALGFKLIGSSMHASASQAN